MDHNSLFCRSLRRINRPWRSGEHFLRLPGAIGAAHIATNGNKGTYGVSQGRVAFPRGFTPPAQPAPSCLGGALAGAFTAGPWPSITSAMGWACTAWAMLALAAGSAARRLPRPGPAACPTWPPGRAEISSSTPVRRCCDTLPHERRRMAVAANVPADCARLRNAVAVTLRRDGAPAGNVVRTEATCRPNIAAAAQQAMRSPRLPDKIDRKVIDTLTVEVEVLSSVRPIERESLEAAVIPGLTGVAYWRSPPASAPEAAGFPSGSFSWVLPSAAYILGLTPRRCDGPP